MKVATIGAGYFAGFHHDGWVRLDTADLAASCDADIEKACEAASRHDGVAAFSHAGEMMDTIQPDLVDIATPPPTHLPLIREAVERGIPVICQKPFCGGLAGAEEAAALARDAGVPLVVHENFRFQPWFREVRRLFEAGAVGDPYQITFRLRPGDGRGPDAYLDRQPYFQTMERLLVHETAVHLVDVFRFILGPVTAVTASLTRLNPVIAGEDAGFILFEFASGARGLFDGNRLSSHAAENRRRTMGELWLEGSDAVIEMNGDGGITLRTHDSNDPQPHDYDWQDTGFAGDCVRSLQAHVIDCLQTGREPDNSAADYLDNLRIVEAIYRSSAEGRRVVLDEITQRSASS
jgi:predicted dehydrogenase